MFVCLDAAACRQGLGGGGLVFAYSYAQFDEAGAERTLFYQCVVSDSERESFYFDAGSHLTGESVQPLYVAHSEESAEGTVYKCACVFRYGNVTFQVYTERDIAFE